MWPHPVKNIVHRHAGRTVCVQPRFSIVGTDFLPLETFFVKNSNQGQEIRIEKTYPGVCRNTQAKKSVYDFNFDSLFSATWRGGTRCVQVVQKAWVVYIIISFGKSLFHQKFYEMAFSVRFNIRPLFGRVGCNVYTRSAYFYYQ